MQKNQTLTLNNDTEYMKFGILKERSNTQDKRTVFSPNVALQIKEIYPNSSVQVESSENRIFSDQEYENKGIEVTNQLEDCDVLFGIKEIPVEDLIPNKSYFFFSHTIKKQQRNKELLQAILDKKIDLYDYETIVDAQNHRLIGFGECAGIVGTYNAIRAFGIKFELFKLPKAATLSGKDAILMQLKRLILPPIKIVVTGNGKVGKSVKEILKAIKIKEVTIENYLTKNYAQAVFTQIDVLDYNHRIDGKVIDRNDFLENAIEYTSHFERFTKVSDIYIAAHFHAHNSPVILSQSMLQANDCKIRVVADIACDADGSIASTLRSSTIADPLYGYFPTENKEVEVFHPAAIVVMAVDNLPCELPKDSSESFGKMFLDQVMPAFFNGDTDGILERAKITENGKLTPRFSYLQDYVDE